MISHNELSTDGTDQSVVESKTIKAFKSGLSRTRQDSIGFITPSRLASSVPVTAATPGMYLVCTASSSSLLTFKETTKMHLFRHFYPGHLCGLWSSCFLLRPLL